MFNSFKEIIESVKSYESSLPFRVIVENETYMIVENYEGYRAYIQLDSISKSGFVKYARAISFSTVHKPNPKTGSGWREKEVTPSSSLSTIITNIIETLDISRHRIISGSEKMDTRQPNTGKKYLTGV